MDNGLQTRKKPHRAWWVVTLFLIGIPTGAFFLARWVLLNYTPDHDPRYLVGAESVAFGGLIGSLVSLSYMLAGGLRESFAAVKARMSDFFSNAGISFRCACRWWREDVKENGAIFWLYFALVLGNFGMFAFGVLWFLKLYTA